MKGDALVYPPFLYFYKKPYVLSKGRAVFLLDRSK